METTLKLELTLDQVNIILAALGEGAFKIVQPVIAEIQKQAAPQLQQPEDVEAAEEENAGDK